MVFASLCLLDGVVVVSTFHLAELFVCITVVFIYRNTEMICNVLYCVSQVWMLHVIWFVWRCSLFITQNDPKVTKISIYFCDRGRPISQLKIKQSVLLCWAISLKTRLTRSWSQVKRMEIVLWKSFYKLWLLNLFLAHLTAWNAAEGGIIKCSCFFLFFLL